MSIKNITINHKTLASPDDTQKIHYHSGYELIFITSGSSEFFVNNKNLYADVGSLIFINNLENHKMYPKSMPYSRYMIIIDTHFLDSFIEESELLSIFKIRNNAYTPHFKIKENDYSYIISLLDKLINIDLEKSDFWEKEFRHYFAILLIFLYKNYKNYFPLINFSKLNQQIIEVQRYIDISFQEDLNLDFLASEFFTDKYYLAHSFKKITGYSIKQYILLKRIAYAKNQLYYTNDSVTNIALNSGFNSQSNFIKLFKKKENITPLQFRKRYKKSAK